MQCRNLVVPALDGELMRAMDGFFCLGCVVVEWCCHIVVTVLTRWIFLPSPGQSAPAMQGMLSLKTLYQRPYLPR